MDEGVEDCGCWRWLAATFRATDDAELFFLRRSDDACPCRSDASGNDRVAT